MHRLRLLIFHHCIPNLVQKILIDAQLKLWPKIEIQDGGRPPSWIFENLNSVQWVALRLLIFRHGIKFGAKMLMIDAQIRPMAKNGNSRWRPPPS